MIPIQTKATNFSLPDQNGNIHSLSDYLGKWVLVYFYPKDNTPGCTTEACAIRDAYEVFKEKGIVVLGISADSVQSHKKFEEKYGLPFTILSDGEKSVITEYGAKGFPMTKRISYLISPDGVVAKIYPKVDPAGHAAEIISDVENLL